MDNKLVKRILKSKGIYIFLGVAVIAAVILKGRGGAEDAKPGSTSTASATAEVTETVPPLTSTAEDSAPTTPADVVINPPSDTVAEKPEETTTSATTVKTTAQTASPPETWTETKIDAAVMYVNTGGIYSRVKPIQGSTKVKSYILNEEVTVVARTSTDYYKTKDGSFIHKDYLSSKKQEASAWKETALTPVRMYVNTDGAYSREKPIQGSTKVNKLKKGQEVTVVAKTDTDYYKAQDGSFIHMDYLDEKQPEVATDTSASTTEPVAEPTEWKETTMTPTAMYVNSSSAYSRKKAIQGSERLNKLQLNQKVTVIAQTDTEYYKLQDGGYVHKDYLTDKNPQGTGGEWNETALSAAVQMRVNSDNVSSRVKPIQGSTKVTALTKGQLVTVVARTDTGYYKLQDGSFVHTDYLDVLQGEQTTEAETNPPEETTAEPEVVVRSVSNANGQRGQEQWEIDYCNQLFDLTNQVRAEYGLLPLERLGSLSEAAVTRAWESTVYNSHTRPDGTSCFTVLTDYGLKLSDRGENLAVWHSTPRKALDSWMNNAAHRNIILNPDFKYMGVGFYYVSDDPKGNYYYWEQLFYAP